LKELIVLENDFRFRRDDAIQIQLKISYSLQEFLFLKDKKTSVETRSNADDLFFCEEKEKKKKTQPSTPTHTPKKKAMPYRCHTPLSRILR
jgi:hypothetical protein